MKSKYLIFTLIVLIAAALIISCSLNNAKRIEEAKKSAALVIIELNEARVSYDEEWPQFQTDAISKIEANEEIIAEFKSGMNSTGKKFKINYKKDIARLEEKNIELKKIVGSFKYEGKEKWDEFKQDFDYDMDSMGKAIKRLYAKKD
jgi:hypothetical protein